MKRHLCIILVFVMLCGMLASCKEDPPKESGGTVPSIPDTETTSPQSGNDPAAPVIPNALTEIPGEYFSAADEQGRLVELHYDTWESTTYAEKTKKLTKRAIVYLPYGYDESKEYNTFYYMHGGWGNETTQMGTPERPSGFKNVIDHAIQNGEIEPMIVAPFVAAPMLLALLIGLMWPKKKKTRRNEEK